MSGGITADELEAEYWRRRKDLAKRVYIEDDSIVLLDGGANYVIDFKRCDTAEKILGWIVHLTEKDWVTTEILERFILLAAADHDINVRGF